MFQVQNHAFNEIIAANNHLDWGHVISNGYMLFIITWPV